MFQGRSTLKGYFEGWYYKFADKNGNHIGALIPGISLDVEGKQSHAFIQYIDDSGILSHYFRYDIKDFLLSDKIRGFGLGGASLVPLESILILMTP